MRLVILESPHAPSKERTVEENIAYAQKCLRDCLLRGEAPIASHLLYTQRGVLDDTNPEERALGIEAGLCWGRFAQATVVYTDRGMSSGMLEGMARAKREDRPVELRSFVAKSRRMLHPCNVCGKLVWTTWFVFIAGTKATCGACHNPPREEAPDPAGMGEK